MLQTFAAVPDSKSLALQVGQVILDCLLTLVHVTVVDGSAVRHSRNAQV